MVGAIMKARYQYKKVLIRIFYSKEYMASYEREGELLK